MGFEGVVPPVPTRQQELNHIKKLEENFLAQPNYKIYMNEALRVRKMIDSEHLNEIKKDWWRHFAMGALYSGLFLIPIRKFYGKRATGVPMYHRPKQYYVNVFMNPAGAANYKAYPLQVFTWLALSYAYATIYTDTSRYDDEYFENVKVVKLFE